MCLQRDGSTKEHQRAQVKEEREAKVEREANEETVAKEEGKALQSVHHLHHLGQVTGNCSIE